MLEQPFDTQLKDIADSMGVSMFQRFSLNEAALFLRCPIADVEIMVKKHQIQFMQVSKTEIQIFGFQLVQHLLDSMVNDVKRSPQSLSNQQAIGQLNQQNEPQDRILRTDEVQEIVGLSRSTIWRLERKGDFPARLPLGVNSVGWRSSDIEKWVHHR